MKIIVKYEKKQEIHNVIVSIYLFSYIRALKINIGKYLKENDNKVFSNKSYINYKNLAKIIWNRFEKLKRHINIDSLTLKLDLGTNDPSVTAILYGMLNGAVPSLICFLNEIIPIGSHYVRIEPNFELVKSNIIFICEVHMNPIFIAYQYITIKRRLKNDQYKSTSD